MAQSRPETNVSAEPNVVRLRVASNMPALGKVQLPGLRIEHVLLSTRGGFAGLLENARIAERCDVLVVNSTAAQTMSLCLLRRLWPSARFRLVSLDILLVEPRTWRGRLSSPLKRQLLRAVDHFILYFMDLRGYERHFGISGERATFVPFKVNCWDDLPPESELSSDGEYVLCCGRSHRDLPTFIRASGLTGLPTVLLRQPKEVMAEHGACCAEGIELPRNVREVVHDGARASWMRWIGNAKVVVIPIRPGVISSPGVSTILDAMALKKCVVITEGPATAGLIHDEALTVPPGDAAELATVITRAWNDDALRESVALAGRRLALRAEGEDRLHSDVVRIAARVALERWMQASTSLSHAPAPSLPTGRKEANGRRQEECPSAGDVLDRSRPHHSPAAVGDPDRADLPPPP
jgi:hypothetical protein